MPILVVFGEPVTVFSPSVESTLPPSILHPPWGAKTIARSGHYHFHLPHQWVVKNFNTTTILNSTTRTFVHYHQKAEECRTSKSNQLLEFLRVLTEITAILYFTEKNVDEELEKKNNNLKIPPFPKYIGKSKSPNYFYNQWVA